MLPYLKQDFPDITLWMAAVSLLLIQETDGARVVHDALCQLMYGRVFPLEKRDDMRYADWLLVIPILF